MRTRLLLAICTFGGIALAQGQTPITIGTSVFGPRYYVDGQLSTGTQQFYWTTGSRHVLQFEIGYDPNKIGRSHV